jgi:hypothetical protein
MRSGIRVVNLALLASTGFFAASALAAQSLTPCIHQVVRLGTERDLFGITGGNVRVAYTVTIKQTYDQTLMDGNTIHWTVEEIQARDEAGRTMRQHIQGCADDGSGQPQLRIQTTVFDPTSKTSGNWAVGPGMMALTSISHLQEPAVQPDWKDIPRTPSTPHTPQITREDLGIRTIAGMEAIGTRMTEVLPAGWEGNDLPLRVTRETWVNSQNHTTLMTIDDDPRTGRHTSEVENLTVGPPDPALFTPPANYRVWDQNPRPQTTADAKP